jgi:hypothetical protein
MSVQEGIAPIALRRQDASKYLFDKHGIVRSTSTLAGYACAGVGPAYIKIGKIPLYRPADLDAWAESITSEKVNNTAEAGMRPVTKFVRHRMTQAIVAAYREHKEEITDEWPRDVPVQLLVKFNILDLMALDRLIEREEA